MTWKSIKGNGTKWHLFHSFFQRNCAFNTIAEYTLLDDGLVKVYNRCTNENGELIEATGRARVKRRAKSNSELEVTFLKVFTWVWAVSGDYIVKSIDPDYTVAITGDEDNSYGWILSRTPSLSLEVLQEKETKLKSLGYDTCRFMMTSNDEQNFTEPTTLCAFVKQ